MIWTLLNTCEQWHVIDGRLKSKEKPRFKQWPSHWFCTFTQLSSNKQRNYRPVRECNLVTWWPNATGPTCIAATRHAKCSCSWKQNPLKQQCERCNAPGGILIKFNRKYAFSWSHTGVLTRAGSMHLPLLQKWENGWTWTLACAFIEGERKEQKSISGQI